MRSRIAVSVLLLLAALPLAAQMIGGGESPAIDSSPDPAGQTVIASQGMDFYSGTVVLDGHGEAWVSMPASFESQNRAFSYQLTAIGAPAPGLYIAQKISGSRFKIAGGKSGMEVSWQVTGIRQETLAATNPPVEEEKRAPEIVPSKRPAMASPAAVAGPSAASSTTSPPPSAASPAVTSSVAPSPAAVASAPKPVALTSEDIAIIKDILERQFKGAYESRNISEVQKVWPDMPRVARKDIANLFESADIQDIRMDLKCKPAITADTVVAYCWQTFSFTLNRKAQAPLQFSVVYRLKRADGEWYLEESRRGLSAAPSGLSD